jgi:hypothetical protein
MTEAQAASTRFLARATGPILILIAVAMFARYETLPEIVPQFAQDETLLLVTCAFTVITGVVMLTAHHHFGSPAAIVLTILAWLIVLRGAMLGVMPGTTVELAAAVAQAPTILLGVVVVAAALGAWLSFVGWFAKSV